MHNIPRWNAVDGSSFRPDGVEVSLAPLLELVEESAPDVAAHMARTGRLARQFALELGVSRALLDLVVRSARVHDVGRLVIADSADEHGVAGQKILERKPALLTLGPVVRAIHERWDGTGYPDGLSGSAIPLPARIIAVCEAYDTLTNPLDSAEPLSPQAAVDELSRRTGTELDPGVVEPFRDLVSDLSTAPTF